MVDRLRAIQLYEADFNWFNGFVFGKEAMDTMTAAGFVPEEPFNQKESMAEDAKFDKTLMCDISCQSLLPLGIVSVDASNCYDRINHLLMALIWLGLTDNWVVVTLALYCFSVMKFHQRTGHGDSKTFFGGPLAKMPFCGTGQGNKGSPANWLQVL